MHGRSTRSVAAGSGAWHTRLRRGLSAMLLVALCACASERRWEGHTDWSNWKDAIRQQGADPWQWGSEATLLAAIPVAALFDDEIREELVDEDAFTHDGRHLEDPLAAALTATPLVLGAWDWLDGDGARVLEVAGESVLSTMLATELLKQANGRERPDGSDDESFPSGHTSKAFMGATFIGRYVDARFDSRLGYLAWLPAAAVGYGRIVHDKHWASDVFAGALLGTFLTNVVWNAHFGPGEGALYGESPKAAWALRPLPLEHGFGLSLSLSL